MYQFSNLIGEMPFTFRNVLSKIRQTKVILGKKQSNPINGQRFFESVKIAQIIVNYNSTFVFNCAYHFFRMISFSQIS